MLKVDHFFNKLIYNFSEIFSIFEAQISEFSPRNKQIHRTMLSKVQNDIEEVSYLDHFCAILIWKAYAFQKKKRKTQIIKAWKIRNKSKPYNSSAFGCRENARGNVTEQDITQVKTFPHTSLLPSREGEEPKASPSSNYKLLLLDFEPISDNCCIFGFFWENEWWFIFGFF